MGSSIEQEYVFRDRYPEREAAYRRFDSGSCEVRQALPCLIDVAYGEGERERFDLFLGEAAGPLIIFVHGGYWQSLSKDRYSFVARNLVQNGFSVALPNYPLAPRLPLAQIVETLYRSVPAIFAASRDAGRAPPFWLASGHSAGGHLAAMMAITDWRVRCLNLPLAGCVPISGIFDLGPLIETSLNGALRLDLQEAAVFSPARIRAHGGRMTAVVGTDETPSFIAQSENYVRHWQACGGRAELALLSGRNHYTILCDLMEERSAIADRILSLAHGFRAEHGG